MPVTIGFQLGAVVAKTTTGQYVLSIGQDATRVFESFDELVLELRRLLDPKIQLPGAQA